MNNQLKSSPLYLLSFGILGLLTYLLNHCIAIYQCALVFTLMVISVNVTTYFYGFARSITALAVAIIVQLALVWQAPYYINGVLFSGLIVASLFSTMISVYWSALLFNRLSNQLGINLSNTLSIAVAAVIDAVIMSVFFVINNYFSYTKILSIFAEEVSYKILYGLVASLIVVTIAYMLKSKNHKIYALFYVPYLADTKAKIRGLLFCFICILILNVRILRAMTVVQMSLFLLPLLNESIQLT